MARNWASSSGKLAMYVTLVALQYICILARREWSPEAAQLLAGARRARRQYSATGEAHHHQSHMALKNRLKKIIRKEGKNNWRRFLEKITSDATKPYNKGL